MKNRNRIRTYSVIVGALYAVMVLATWLIFGEDLSIGNALSGAVVYAFYLTIVFGAVALACVVAVMLKREHDSALRH